MLDKNKLVKVKNRDTGIVGYSIPDMNNLKRTFNPNEIKEITVEELKKLHYRNGGDYILKNYLLIEDQEVLKEILDGEQVEPEYFYTEKEITNLLLYGSLDEFLDCLDFAPEGVIEIIKNLAVKLELNDVKKREAIFKRTGLNVNTAILFEKETKEDDEEKIATRRVNAEKTVAETAAPARRVANTGKYTVKN